MGLLSKTRFKTFPEFSLGSALALAGALAQGLPTMQDVVDRHRLALLFFRQRPVFLFLPYRHFRFRRWRMVVAFIVTSPLSYQFTATLPLTPPLHPAT